MKSKSLIGIAAEIILILILVEGVQAAETYHYIEKWGSSGAGNGQFTSPYGIAVDTSGNVYVSEPIPARIQKFDSLHVFKIQWGYPTYTYMQWPAGSAVDISGYVYDAEGYDSPQIVKFTSLGVKDTSWITPGCGSGCTPTDFTRPRGVAVGGSGNVYVVSYSNNLIQKFGPTGTYLAHWGGTQGSGNGQFNSPEGIAVDNAENVYVADTGNNRIQKFTSTGTYSMQWGSSGTGNGQFNSPKGIAVDSAGNVYVADTGNNRIQKFTSTGTYLTQWGSAGTNDGEFNSPIGVAIDTTGNVYVVDSGNNRVQVFYPSPTVTSISPNNGFNINPALDVEIRGTNFVPSYLQLSVFKSEGGSIPVTNVNVVNSDTITCTLDLTGIPPDSYDVYYSNPDGQSAYLYGGFTVAEAPSSPVAVFDGTPQSGTAPLTVTFTDSSTGDIATRTWEYKRTTDTSWIEFALDGDNAFTFTSPGTYDVQLTVAGTGGSDTMTWYSFVTVSTPGTTGDIRVESVPDGADVTIDTTPQTLKTNTTFTGFTPGVHTVKVTHAGYFNAQRQVTVESGATVTTVIAMDVVPSTLDPLVKNAVQVVLDEKLNGDSTGKTVSAYPTRVLTPKVDLWADDPPLQFTTGTCSLVLVDPTPAANWEHPVTYICVDATGTITETKEAHSPATNYAFTYAAGENPGPGEYWVPNDPKAWYPTACTENCNNYYAVLIDGGTDRDHNYIRYWNDIAFMYITLIEYGYAPSHITVLMSDGSGTANDRCIATSGTTCTQNDSSPQDLNGDKVAETILPATKAQVQTTLTNLKSSLKTTDNLFIFTTGHGSGNSGGNSKLLLWNNEYIADTDFYSALLPNRAKNITMVMEQCYGGGFNDNFLSGADITHSRVLITATNINEPSYGNGFSNAWTTGVAGHTRYNPTTYDPTADASGDKRVSMTESSTYANTKDPYAVSGTEHPQKYSSPSTAVNVQYLNDCPPGSVTKSITVTYPTLPGYSWPQGSFHELTWDEKGISGNVNIILVKGTTELSPALATVPALPGSYSWTIPVGTATGSYKIRVKATDGTSGTSTNTFSIIAKPAVNTGSLVFSTNPKGASVYLDGSATASGTTTTPLTVSNLVQGDHRAVVKLSKYYDQSFKVTVTAQQTNTLPTWVLDAVPTDANGVAEDYSPFGGLDVRSDPDGANIWIARTGQTAVNKGMSPAVLQLEPGDYRVYLTKDGYQQTESKTVTVEKLYPDRAPVVVDFTLTSKPTGVIAQALIVPQLLNIGRTGYFVAFVRLPTGYKAADVDAGSVYCENKQALKLIRLRLFPQIFAAIFSRQDLAVSTGTITMTVRGTVKKNGATVPFSGITNVNVINKKVTTKEDVDTVMTMPDAQVFSKFNKF